MKILFAVSNEYISEAIIKKYQDKYNEIIRYKNVYYFNAIIKELQTDNSYDRIIISEDLEAFSNNNILSIDKFLFSKMDRVSDEAQNHEGERIPIIFITNENRNFESEIIAKYFSIGIYDVLVGNDRTITKICELINKPRNKKEAKMYYHLNESETTYKKDNIKELVSEIEIKNILRFYKGISNTPEKYGETFEKIAKQYNDEQLKYIVSQFPMEIKFVLEKDSRKYNEIIGKKQNTKITVDPSILNNQNNVIKNENNQNTNINENLKVANSADNINSANNTINNDDNVNQEKATQNIVIPKEVVEAEEKPIIEDYTLYKKQEKEQEELAKTQEEVKVEKDEPKVEVEKPSIEKKIEENKKEEIIVQENNNLVSDNGYIDFSNLSFDKNDKAQEEKIEKNIQENQSNDEFLKIESNEIVNNPVDEEIEIPTNVIEEIQEKEKAEQNTDNISEELLISEKTLTDIKQKQQEEEKRELEIKERKKLVQKSEEIIHRNKYKKPNISEYLKNDKKIVAFVGTSKNGVSFLINSLGAMFSSIGVNTAILDVTKNRNSYYLCTQGNEDLRKIAIDSIKNLENDVAKGVEVNKNLTIYTSLPGENEYFVDGESIYRTLLNNHNLILVDTDFETNFSFFAGAKDIFLVQSLDILTMQKLTEFLVELKEENIIKDENVKVVINKEVPIKGITKQMILKGLSKYNSPDMSIMRELFNPEIVKATSIPFDQTVYQKYLENIIYCKYDISGYPIKFIDNLKLLAGLVYSTVGKTASQTIPQVKSQIFTDDNNDFINRKQEQFVEKNDNNVIQQNIQNNNMNDFGMQNLQKNPSNYFENKSQFNYFGGNNEIQSFGNFGMQNNYSFNNEGFQNMEKKENKAVKALSYIFGFGKKFQKKKEPPFVGMVNYSTSYNGGNLNPSPSGDHSISNKYMQNKDVNSYYREGIFSNKVSSSLEKMRSRLDNK